MSTDTGTSSPFESEQSTDRDDEAPDADGGIHPGALYDAVRATVTAWGFTALMAVFVGISLSTSVYTSVVYPVFFGLSAVGAFAIAVGQTYVRYGHYRFERTHDGPAQRNA